MFGFFHLCAHEIIYKTRDMFGHEIELANSGFNLIQVIAPNTVITEIIDIIPLAQNPFPDKLPMNYDKFDVHDKSTQTRKHYDENPAAFFDYAEYIKNGTPIPKELYERYLNNRIKWSVLPPTSYKIVVNLTIRTEHRVKEAPNNCTRCDGKGWYVDLTNDERKFVEARGAYKVLQQVIKDLLTKVTSSRFLRSYGTRLHLSPQKNYDPTVFEENIMLDAMEVESNYMLRQNEHIHKLPLDEILVSLVIEEVRVRPDNKTQALLVLRIITEQEDKYFQLKI